SSEEVAEAAARASEALNEQAETGDVAQKDLSKAETRLRWITQKELPKLKKYERQQQTLGERGSYSRPALHAAFMRLTGLSPLVKLPSPPYNLRRGRQNQFIIGYSLHSHAADKVDPKSHLDRLDFTPGRLCADAGYGPLANSQMLEQR